MMASLSQFEGARCSRTRLKQCWFELLLSLQRNAFLYSYTLETFFQCSCWSVHRGFHTSILRPPTSNREGRTTRSMDIKWTAGPGPAPLPYSKRAREAMGVSDDEVHYALLDLSLPLSQNSLPEEGGREALRQPCPPITRQDKPWAHPDPPVGESLGLDGDPLREGRLRATLFLMVSSIIMAIWVYRKFVKRDRSPFFHVAPTASEEAEVSEEEARIAREARLKRFEGQKSSYADIMKAAAGGGWSPGDDDGDAGGGEGSTQSSATGLRHRGGNQGRD